MTIWVRANQNSDALARLERVGGEIHVTDLFRRDLPPGSGSDLLAQGLHAAGVSPGQTIRLTNVINQPTLDAIRAGTPAADTVLGRSVTNALGQLGIAPQSISAQVVGSKLDIVVVVQ